MFNREYQRRATKQGLTAVSHKSDSGGHQEAALRLPWAGVFEPWRPFVLVAAAAAQRPERAFQRRNAAKGCKNSRQLKLFDDKLLGMQLALFPDNEILTEDQLAGEFTKLFS